jgi:hypothetical protein
MTLLAGRDKATAPEASIGTMDKPLSHGPSETGRCDDVQVKCNQKIGLPILSLPLSQANLNHLQLSRRVPEHPM